MTTGLYPHSSDADLSSISMMEHFAVHRIPARRKQMFVNYLD